MSLLSKYHYRRAQAVESELRALRAVAEAARAWSDAKLYWHPGCSVGEPSSAEHATLTKALDALDALTSAANSSGIPNSSDSPCVCGHDQVWHRRLGFCDHGSFDGPVCPCPTFRPASPPAAVENA